MRNTLSNSIGVAAFLSVLSACGTTGFGGSPTYSPASPPIAASSAVSGYGTVQSVELVPRDQAGIGLGTIAGGVVGGILGNQIGQGRGNTAATVAGVAGGALAGRELENRSRQTNQVYRVTVQMNNGSLQSIVQENQPTVRIGERVRIANGIIERV